MHMLKWLWGLDTRLLEVFLGLSLLRRGLVWVAGYGDLSPSYYAPLRAVGDVNFWGWLFVILGLMQIAGVLINGNWHRSPALRIFVLIASASAYLLLGLAFHVTPLTGSAAQASTREFSSLLFCVWCALNVSAKWGRKNE